jgi:leucyl/phenylalanyl-tRNA--protein transferase
VLLPDEIRVSTSLRKTLRSRDVDVTLDRAFADVMSGCAAPRARQRGTWLTPDMQRAYARLHELGYAHSVEVWDAGTLAGGLYGVALGRVFFGESMFSRVRDASKVALVHLVAETHARGLELIDCQVQSQHLASLGSRAIPRRDFLSLIAGLCDEDRPGSWTTTSRTTKPPRRDRTTPQ